MDRVPSPDPIGREGAGIAAGEGGCGGSEDRSLLVLYALASCREEEAVAFEAHLLGCEACFQDLKTLDRAREILREFTGSTSPVLDRVRQALQRQRVGDDVASEPRST